VTNSSFDMIPVAISETNHVLVEDCTVIQDGPTKTNGGTPEPCEVSKNVRNAV